MNEHKHMIKQREPRHEKRKKSPTDHKPINWERMEVRWGLTYFVIISAATKQFYNNLFKK